jgi:hypothetical protein
MYMKIRKDPGSKKKVMPQSEGSGIIKTRAERTCCRWKREGTDEGGRQQRILDGRKSLLGDHRIRQTEVSKVILGEGTWRT